MPFEQFLRSIGIDPDSFDSLDDRTLQRVMGQYEHFAQTHGFDPMTGEQHAASQGRGNPQVQDFGSIGVDWSGGGDTMSVPPPESPGFPPDSSLPPPPLPGTDGTDGSGSGSGSGSGGGSGSGSGGGNPPRTGSVPPPGSSPWANYRPSDPFYRVSNGSIQEMGEQDRLGAWSWLHGMTQGLQDDQNYYRGYEDLYNGLLLGPTGYGNILSGQTGYTPQQAADILQEDRINGALPGEEELNDMALRDYDYASIPGDPWGTRDAYAGFMDQLWGIADNANTNQRGVAQAFGTNLDSTIDPVALSVDPNYGRNRTNVVDAYSQFLLDSGAYGDRAQMDPAYAQAQIDNSDSYAQDLGSYDPNRMSLSDEFNQDYQFGPEDEQRMRNQAARDAAARYRSTADRVTRSAAATSNATPLAIASALGNMNYDSARAEADAVNDASIRGRQLALNTTAGREKMRLGSEQQVADQLSRAATQIADFRRGTMSDIESRRMSGEQFSANRAGTLGQDLYNQYGDIVRDNENRRLASNQDIATRRYNAARDGGQAVLSTEARIGDRDVANAQFNVDTMGRATDNAERLASDRARTLADMRMTGAANRANTRYQTGMGAANALRTGYQGVYGAQRQDEQEGRGFLAGQSNSTANTGRSIAQQRIGAAGTGFGAANAGTAAVTAGRQPSWWERLISVGAGAAGAALGGGG